MLVLGVSTVLTSFIYSPTIYYGFYYDDYHFVRPYTAHEVLSSFDGPWDASGIETAYYRPLTICLYAVRFAALGLNARAHHIMSLVMFGAAAALFAVFVSLITGSRTAGLLGAGVFIVHPGMPYAAIAWITNQMHLAQMIVVLTALNCWFAVRHRSPQWWMPLLAFQAAAFLIKEDGIMLIPAIVVLHLLRKYFVERDLPHVPLPFLTAAAVLGGSLLMLRSTALHGFPSHRLPSFDQAWTNWSSGFGVFRLVPAKRPWQLTASWFVTLAPVTALVAWRRAPREVRFAMVASLALAALFDLPFVFLIKPEQVYLITAGAALLIAASLTAVLGAFARQRLLQIAVVAIAVGGLAAMAAVARNIARDFDPYGPIVLRTDRIVEEWAAVPLELREYLASKRTSDPADRPDPDPSRALPVVAFGLHGRERSPDGIPLRWMAGATADVFVRRGTRLVSFSARHERGAFREPAHVRIEADGRTVTDTMLDDGRWHRFDIPLPQRAWMGLSGMHRIRVSIDHAWVPAKIIPGSGDGRTLGLQIGVIETR